ncbi:MAG TPA: lysophospholipid acyltransferase family protein [Syntrophales bacterium]|nr:lysophospholipid acyltransferase family protein [Syntrophales bacterium]
MEKTTRQTPLLIQYILGRVAIFLLGPLYFAIIRLLGYRVKDIRKVRKECSRHFRDHEGPWIICANHLTMIDSFIISYALYSLPRHLTQFRQLPWNLPERDNFQRNILLAIICYLAKCIPINRGGNREEMKKTLDECNALLEWKQTILIFPEGGRSRTGRINTEGYSYGVGRFVKEFEDCKILCVYMRGDGQQTYGFIPRFGERFTVNMEILQPELTDGNGLRAQRFYAEQIIRKLAQMEEGYFNSHRQRHSGSERSAQHEDEQESAIRQPRLYPQ